MASISEIHMMVPANILYLNHAAYLGGAEIALLNLLTYLDRERFQPVVLSPPGALADAVGELDIPWKPIPVLDGLNRYNIVPFLRTLPFLAATMSREKPDLLHANTNFTSQYAGTLARWLRIPTVGHIRDIEPLGRMGRWTVRQNSRLIAISNAVEAYLVNERMPTQKIVRVYDGVDLKQYQPQDERRQHEDQMMLGIVGQIGERKGHCFLLEAVRQLIPEFPAIRLWIIGKEPEHSTEHCTAQLHQYIHKHTLESYVKFWGFREDIFAMLSQLDILVVPSLQEPFGKIVIEGMAMAKPVVASRVGGIPEIIVDGETGLLVAPGDAETLRRALYTLLTNPEKRHAMGRRGRLRVEQFFTLRQNVRKTENVYTNLLQRK